MENNIITAVFNGSKFATTDYLWQYDYGQILKISGIDLPELYEVHVSGSASGSAVTVFGDANGIAIPDEYLMKSGSITMYIYLHTGESDGETEYKITIPVKSRVKPTHETPTPVQQTEIEQVIAELENSQGRAEAAAETAEQAATSATSSAQAAATSEQNASDSEDTAMQYARNAQQSATSAASSASSASTSETNAAQSAEDAEHYADVAEQVANTAGYMFMEIDSNGHLVYTRTDQVDADFHIERSVGHLILEAV